jgi:hypothetical protein
LRGRALLQFDNYFVWLEGSTATILRPHQTPLLGQYDFASGVMTPSATPADPLQVDKAMSHVILPSILYREQRYKLPR